jgi:hypothetical protein
MSGGASFIPNPPVARHGVIGDRRTAALVAADGTIPWLCLPCYDGVPIFGALLDVERGGCGEWVRSSLHSVGSSMSTQPRC